MLEDKQSVWVSFRRVRRVLVCVLSVVCCTISAEAQLHLQPFASGFSMPVAMVQDPTNSSIHFVVEQGGRIRVLQNRTVLSQDLLDLTDLVSCCGESGLFSLAFPPDAAVTGRFFVHYTNAQGNNVVARYRRSPANALVVDPSTRFDLVWASIGNLPYIPNPSDATNHNGGDMAFGSDGFLYITLGDGGPGNDPQNRAQDPTTLLGKILRIDINVAAEHPHGYQVPASNPFVDNIPIAALSEIWDFGLRNPWRFSFDIGAGGTGAMIVADVGQSSREEINYEPAGGGGRNFGWRLREGTEDHITSLPPAYTPLTNPVYEYDRSVGFVITGGYVYRGNALSSSYRGRYFFTDFGTARLWSLGLNVNSITGEASVSNVLEHTSEVGGTGAIGNVSSFARDTDGELYLIQYAGSIVKLSSPPVSTISGTVTDLEGVGLNNVGVAIHDQSGSLVTTALTNSTGHFVAPMDLQSGIYFARTSNTSGYGDELYDNLPCPGGTCNETAGTPIAVTAGSRTTGIDFALAPDGSAGTVSTRATLNFSGTNTAGMLNPITPPQTVTVAFTGVSNSTWSATADQPWVELTGASGTGSGTFSVNIINPGGVLPSNVLNGQAGLSATITLTATNVTNSPRRISVNLILQPASNFAPPIGLVETPVQNASGVVGAIAVTGWVVDDVGISSVQVHRNCLSFEPQTNCQLINGQNVVFIGNATLVPGARPDISALFATYPASNVGGWGYLLLTSMLPHIPNAQLFGGQGSLMLYAFATDLEGHVKQLGRTQVDTTPTSITMNNTNIAKPFGAIDTPGQGATISGASYANFGWSLTPDNNTMVDTGDVVVPTDGSTMSVLIDGAPVGTVSFNQCRGTVLGPVPVGVFCDDDVSNIFGNPTPQAPFTPRVANPTRHRNLDAGRGPIGAYILDTTALSNGIHTIMWVVFDSAGRGEGIGSRFFTVLNGSSLTASEHLSTAATLTVGTAETLADYPVDAGTVWAQQGFTTPREELLPDATGRLAARMPAQGRLEVALGEGIRAGYLVANGTLRALPPGSRLDAAIGLFTWHPMLGYLGTYELTFVRENGTQVPISVTLEPEGIAPGHIDMAIDHPAAGATVHGAFTVEGWALDTGAWQGSGIGAVHVWAQRVDMPAVESQFLGASELNGGRPDVATIYGKQFERAGWALSVPGLAPGTYDLTAYVWRTSTQQFEDARSVRIIVVP
jgi:glucose/arabinose dehydrogenase